MRNRGLASACGAALILECLERGLYPSWDAHTEISAALAEKLGYHVSHPYVVYEVEADKGPVEWENGCHRSRYKGEVLWKTKEKSWLWRS